MADRRRSSLALLLLCNYEVFMSLPPQKNGNNGRMTPAGIEPASQPWKGRITNRLDHGAMHGSIAATLYIFERLLMLHRIFPCSRKIGIWTQICGFGDHRAATYTILLFFRPCRIWSWRESNPCPELVLMQNLYAVFASVVQSSPPLCSYVYRELLTRLFLNLSPYQHYLGTFWCSH